jgi:glycosyltransferase involved in cell wall biosynthesis
MISIAMTTYNGERFLEEQLRSLTEQTTLPNELVVCDDGSTDRTPEILAQFAKRASFPVRIVINNHRLGWRENFLKAASLYNSDYIAFWHFATKMTSGSRRNWPSSSHTLGETNACFCNIGFVYSTTQETSFPRT